MSLPTSLIPANDAERLLALAPYRVLGTAPDAVFDEVVRFTAKLFNVPIALVSLVDEGSVWFKANFGLGGAERVQRNESVCSVAILQEDTTVYENLRQTPCQLTEPGVAEALHMQFYAGHPLRNDAGYQIGALCIIDRQPRQLSAAEQARLQKLATVVMKMLDLRLALQHQPQKSAAVWLLLYDHLDQSLTRLDTLAELSRWEESPDTPQALLYQRSLQEEAELVTNMLDSQTSRALTAMQPAQPH